LPQNPQAEEIPQESSSETTITEESTAGDTTKKSVKIETKKLLVLIIIKGVYTRDRIDTRSQSKISVIEIKNFSRSRFSQSVSSIHYISFLEQKWSEKQEEI